MQPTCKMSGNGRYLHLALKAFALLAALLSLSAVQPAAAQSFTATELGTLAGYSSSTNYVAYAINNRGLVVGIAYPRHHHGRPIPTSQAFLFEKGVMTALDTFPGGSGVSSASAINERGQVVGGAIVDGTIFLYHAFLYEKGAMTDIGTLPGGLGGSFATGINDRGQIVGYSGTANGVNHAFLYTDGVMADLGTLPGGDRSSAYAINNGGQVVGNSNTTGSASHAFLFDKGAMIDLGTLPGGNTSVATGINDRGQIVGNATTAGGAVHAFLFGNAAMADLGTLPGGDYSVATGINNNGQVVGYSNTTSGGTDYHAFFFCKRRHDRPRRCAPQHLERSFRNQRARPGGGRLRARSLCWRDTRRSLVTIIRRRARQRSAKQPRGG